MSITIQVRRAEFNSCSHLLNHYRSNDLQACIVVRKIFYLFTAFSVVETANKFNVLNIAQCEMVVTMQTE